MKFERMTHIERFGLQLDHWTNGRRENILLISISALDNKWRQILQVIEFSVVSSTQSDVTVSEINSILQEVHLDQRKSLAV